MSPDALIDGARVDAASYSFEEVKLDGPPAISIAVGDSVFAFVDGEGEVKVGQPEQTNPDVVPTGIDVSYLDAGEGSNVTFVRFRTGRDTYYNMAEFQAMFTTGDKNLQEFDGFTFEFGLNPETGNGDSLYQLQDRITSARSGGYFRITDTEQPDPNVMAIKVRAEFSGVLVDDQSGDQFEVTQAVIVGTFRGNACDGPTENGVCREAGYVPAAEQTYSMGPSSSDEPIGDVPSPILSWLESEGYSDWTNTGNTLGTMALEGDPPPHENYKIYYNSTLVDALTSGTEPPVGSAAVAVSSTALPDGTFVARSPKIMVRGTSEGDAYDWWYGDFGNVHPDKGVLSGYDTSPSTSQGTCYACHSTGTNGPILSSLPAPAIAD